MKKVLIAHQSTIPHYRVPFYNALQKCKPDDWSFDVAFDSSELDQGVFFKEKLSIDSFHFPTLEVKTIVVKIAGKNITYQSFLAQAAKYDLIIVEQALNNLSYSLCHLHRLRGTKLAYWGHGKHAAANNNPSLWKNLSEQLKTGLTNQADGFFAYTPRGKSFVVNQGFAAEKVFTIYNTVDIKIQRQAFTKFKSQREKIRRSLDLINKKVLLFVGRFSKTKRIELLLEAFSIMQTKDPSFHLLLVGSGAEKYLLEKLNGVSYFGAITDLNRLAPIYIAADVITHPGSVGLAPIQALCYDLPIITIDSPIHPPEIEYLSSNNSLVLPFGTTPKDYAQSVAKLFKDSKKMNQLQAKSWSTINHLTIKNMAQNFARGIDSMLN